MWWKKNRWKVILPVLVAAVLAAAFWYGGGAPGMQGWTVEPSSSEQQEQLPTDGEEGLSDIGGGSAEAENPVLSSDGEENDPAQGGGPTSRPGGSEGGMTAQEKVDRCGTGRRELRRRGSGRQGLFPTAGNGDRSLYGKGQISDGPGS